MNTLKSGLSEKLEFDLTAEDAGDSGHICGGTVHLFVEPFQDYDINLLNEINDIRTGGGSGVLATVIQEGSGASGPMSSKKMLYRRDGSSEGQIPGYEAEIWRESGQIMRRGQPALLHFGGEEIAPGIRRGRPEEATEIFMEPITIQPLVYLIGGGHVSFCVAQAAHLAGFRIAVVEDRPAFANAERFPIAEDFYVGEFPGVLDEIPVDESSYITIITRGHTDDEVALEWALRTPARYIGMIGSKSKVLLTYRHLRDKGFDRDEIIQRVHAPIGLDIGADTPGEIGIAIAAELIRHRRKGDAPDNQAIGSKRVQLRRRP